MISTDYIFGRKKKQIGNYLLDPYPVFGIYATHRLHTDHTKFATVKRSSDNVETDILFSDDALTLNSEVEAGGTLGSFLGGNSGNLTNFINGTGNSSYDIFSTQPPRLVNSGVLDSKNGKAAIDFNGNQRFLRYPGPMPKLQTGSSYTIFTIASARSIGHIGAVFCTSQILADRLVIFRDTRNNPKRNIYHDGETGIAAADLSVPTQSTDAFLQIASSDGDSISAWHNNVEDLQNIPLSGNISNEHLIIGSQLNNTTNLNGTFQALILIEGYLPEADRNYIRDGLNQIYNCYSI